MIQTTMIRGGKILARTLQTKGVENVFTLAGGFCNAALEGLMECGIKTLNCPHEQIAGFLADAYTRIKRKPAVCFIGPEGFANTIGAMIEAWGERTPIIFITSSSTLRRKGAGGFKEIDDVAIAAPLTKFSVGVTDGIRLREIIDRAWNIATTGYPGAVHISIPVDIMFASYPEDAGMHERPFDWSVKPAPKAWPQPEALEKILDTIARAKKTIFMVGHGIWWSGAEKQLNVTSSELGIPVFNMSEHRKVLPQDAKAYMGLTEIHQNPPATAAFVESDVIIALGCILDNTLEFGNPTLFPAKTPLICVNGSDEELQLNHSADMVLLSDPGAFLDALLTLKTVGKWILDDSWLNENQARRIQWAEDTLTCLSKEEQELGRDSLATGKVHPLRVSLEVQKLCNGLIFL